MGSPAAASPRTPGVSLGAVAERAEGSLDADANARAALITGATVDSRAARRGDLFGALPGAARHGAEFSAQAADSGAAAILTDRDGAAAARAAGLPVIVAADPRASFGRACAAIFGDPSHQMTLVGITGTNGKTTTTFLIDAALRREHPLTGVLGTVGVRIGDVTEHAERTTAEAPEFQGTLRRMVDAGVTGATTEVSSHALALGRVSGTRFAVAAFSNLQWDHLDFHHTMEEYFAAKASLFTPELALRGVVCVDDEWGQRLAREATVPVTTLATRPEAGEAQWTVVEARVAADGVGSRFAILGPDGQRIEASTILPASINVSNAALAILTAEAAGVPRSEAVEAIAGAGGPPGRMERVLERGPDTPLAIVDYAHTPDALERILEGARAVTPGRLISVFGSGGDRDTGKRPKKGRIAAALADVVIVTDDNPRSEDPGAIRAAIIDGAREVRPALDEVHEVAPRERAIAFALEIAERDDTVVLSGKGHEDYQEIDGVRTPFSDPEHLRAALARRKERR